MLPVRDDLDFHLFCFPTLKLVFIKKEDAWIKILWKGNTHFVKSIMHKPKFAYICIMYNYSSFTDYIVERERKYAKYWLYIHRPSEEHLP